MPNDIGGARALTPVSPELAQLWLQQQQQPDAALADIGVWRLRGTVSAGQVAAAWGRVWAEQPDLRLIFDLDDSGDVVARQTGPGLAPLHLLQTSNPAEADAALRDVLDCGDARLVALALAMYPEGATMALRRHQLLRDRVGIDGLLDMLTAALEGRALPVPRRRSGDQPVPDWLNADTHSLDPAPVILDEFRHVLGLPDLDADDDFFDHGGHSLLATRVIGRLLDRHGIEIAFDDIFAHATAARLAQRARVVRSTAPALSAPPEESAEAPLSLAQHSLWKASAAHGHGAVFNLPFVLRFLGPVDEDVFAAAFRDLMIRHPVLRSRFAETDGVVTQRVVPESALDSYQWWWPSHAAGHATLASEAEHPFDLSRELPVRLRFFRDEAGQLLSFLFHHIVIDEWSLSQLMAELGQAYAARASGQPPVWPQSPPPFHVFASEQRRSTATADHLAWWTAHLRDLPPRPLVFAEGQPAPMPAEAAPAPRGLLRLDLDPALATGLRRAARRLDASLFNLFHAGMAATLHTILGQDRLAVGTSASGRQAARWFDTVGYFTTVVCHCLRFAPQMTLADLVAQSRDLVTQSLPHSEMPIDLVEEALPGGPPPPGTHVFEVFVQIHAGNALNGALPDPAGPIPYRQVELGTPPSILPLHVEVMEDVTTPDHDLHVTLNHCARRYDAGAAAAILSRLHRVLTCIATPEGAALCLADLAAATADPQSKTQKDSEP